MEVLAGIFELTFLLDAAWTVVGLPVLLLLGALTVAGTVGSRRSVWGAGSQAGSIASPEAARLQPTAQTLAFWVVGLGCVLVGIVFASATITVPEGAWATASLWVLVVGMVLQGALCLAVVIVLVRIARDVLKRCMVAGRQTWIAYGLLLAGHAGILALALATGAFKNIVG